MIPAVGDRLRTPGTEPVLGSLVRANCLPPVVGAVIALDRNRHLARVRHATGEDWFGWGELRPYDEHRSRPRNRYCRRGHRLTPETTFENECEQVVCRRCKSERERTARQRQRGQP